MRAKDYRPAHGGYPTARRRRVRGGVFAKVGAVVVNNVTPPAVPGFPVTAIHEAYQRGLQDGRAGGGPGWGNRR